MEASFFQREKVLQYPGCRDLIDDIDPVEFKKKRQKMRE
jgi:hypothetical protein